MNAKGESIFEHSIHFETINSMFELHKAITFVHPGDDDRSKRLREKLKKKIQKQKR